MQILRVDNFGRDYQTEHVEHTNLTEEECETLLKAHQDTCTVNGPWWYISKPDDYIPYVFDGY